MGKFYVITSAIEADLIFLAVFGILSSILSMWYYLRLIIVMYFREPEDQFEIAQMTFAPIGTIILAVSVFALSFFPVVL
jgi:NADH-quinone oxidoreductase subunit N